MASNGGTFLLQGFFFQDREVLGLGIRAGDGVVAVIRQELVRDMFAGLIWWDELRGWLGNSSDRFGLSDLTNVRLTDSMLSFDKQYQQRPDVIHYELTLDGDIWVGAYSGDVTGVGAAKCILTPMPTRMLEV